MKIAQISSKASRLESLPATIKRKIPSSRIFSGYLKEITGGTEILTEALKQLLDITTLLKEEVPRESGISLEPVQNGSKQKQYSFCVTNVEKERFTCWKA